ncbi:SKI/DACH domain-containing protein 1-like [Canna indica]|uniref:SKI/DACH domain-containing protein 1-like n=1 Tax=Canna indica TaxID=4628 RepID=A0AAQ3K7R1_9LILI|nr:SKI/DACH domain-containing protein 1-like [Canna indica]
MQPQSDHHHHLLPHHHHRIPIFLHCPCSCHHRYIHHHHQFPSPRFHPPHPNPRPPVIASANFLPNMSHSQPLHQDHSCAHHYDAVQSSEAATDSKVADFLPAGSQDQEWNENIEEDDDYESVFVLTDEWMEFFAKSEAKRRLAKQQKKRGDK